MASVDGEQVWTALCADSAFQREVSENERLILKPFIVAAPEVLADYLDKPLTLETLLGAKLAFVRYCVDHGMVEEFTRDSALSDFAEMLSAALSMVLEQLEAIASDIPAFLAANGVIEEDVMTSPQIGLNEENARKCQDNTLTIAELLRTQPSVITKNT